MNQLFVIGDPVAHSKSPVIHSAMLGALGLEETWCYQARRVAGDETARWLAEATANGVCGFNATMPHKECLVHLVDELSPDAALCQSVNTVCIKGGRTFGYSTDGAGFLQALSDAGVDPRGCTVTLLGAGGAAKAVVLKLAAMDVKGIMVCNRDYARAQALCRHNPQLITAAGFDRASLMDAASQSQLLINCTPLGMTGVAGTFTDFSFLDVLPPQAAVCDLIYSPLDTDLLARARAGGHIALNGMGMLLNQAAFSLAHFLGRPLDLPAMRRAAERALSTQVDGGVSAP